MCVEGVLCSASEPLLVAFEPLMEVSTRGVQWIKDIYELLKPHLTWIGWLFGLAMWVWRTWNKREIVAWRRTIKLLEDQGRYLQEACRYSLAAIAYPSPAASPRQPLFAVNDLREVLARRWWSVPRTASPLQWGQRLLGATHLQLNDKDNTIAAYRSFANAQRYSAFVLEGALAAAEGEIATHSEERNRLNHLALSRFENALAIEGRDSDEEVRELEAWQLKKLGRNQAAKDKLGELEALLIDRLQKVTQLRLEEQRRLFVRLIRVVRCQLEIDHQSGAQAYGSMTRFLNYPIAERVLNSHLERQDRLERAFLHEVHACVRFRAQHNIIARRALSNAEDDYAAILSQLAPSRQSWPMRLWRWLNRSDEKDGSAQLRTAAEEGQERLRNIQAGKGCRFCASPAKANGQASPTAPTSP